LLARRLAERLRARREDLRQMEEEEREMKRQREAADAVARERKEAEKREAEAKRDAKLRVDMNQRCAVEQMCQGLPNHLMAWEEDPGKLTELLKVAPGSAHERWLGKHETKKTARRQYLLLARKWHPDKWALQGDTCVQVATDVTKCLVAAYEKAMKDLPADTAYVSCEDEDEEREVNEFASWVGISFQGMHEVWKQRKRMTAGR